MIDESIENDSLRPGSLVIPHLNSRPVLYKDDDQMPLSQLPPLWGWSCPTNPYPAQFEFGGGGRGCVCCAPAADWSDFGEAFWRSLAIRHACSLIPMHFEIAELTYGLVLSLFVDIFIFLSSCCQSPSNRFITVVLSCLSQASDFPRP